MWVSFWFFGGYRGRRIELFYLHLCFVDWNSCCCWNYSGSWLHYLFVDWAVVGDFAIVDCTGLYFDCSAFGLNDDDCSFATAAAAGAC